MDIRKLYNLNSVNIESVHTDARNEIYKLTSLAITQELWYEINDCNLILWQCRNSILDQLDEILK